MPKKKKNVSKRRRIDLGLVARFVSAIHTSAKYPEAVNVFQWIVKKNLELVAGGPEAGAVALTPFELAELRLCFMTRASTKRAADLGERLLRRFPETAKHLETLESLGRDAGLADQWRLEGPRAIQLNEEVNRLLENRTWNMAARFIEANVLGEPIYDAWVGILEARMARGAGDPARLMAVRDKLRAEATTLQSSVSLLMQGQLDGLAGHDPEN